jgi:hypothetical protein
MKKHSTRKYLAYLLRLWQDADATSWRVTQENLHNGKHHGFSDLKKLFAFLEGITSNQY